MLFGDSDAEAGSGEHLMSGTHGGWMEVVIEGVGPEKNFGGGRGECGAAVTAAARVAGQTAVGSEGFGEAREGALRVDVKRFFDEGVKDGGVVDGVDEVRGEAGETGEDVDAAEGVVRERTGFVFVVVSEEFGLVRSHVDGDRALGFAGLAGETGVERLLDLFVLPLVGKDLTLHEFP